MSIDINGISTPKVHAPKDDSQLKPALEQQQKHVESGKSSTADTVSLSDNAVQLGKVDNTAITAPVVDAKRVEQVKQAISDGSFKIDTDKIADKLMKFETVLTSDK